MWGFSFLQANYFPYLSYVLSWRNSFVQKLSINELFSSPLLSQQDSACPLLACGLKKPSSSLTYRSCIYFTLLSHYQLDQHINHPHPLHCNFACFLGPLTLKLLQRANECLEINRFAHFPDIQISGYINKKVPNLAVQTNRYGTDMKNSVHFGPLLGN